MAVRMRSKLAAGQISNIFSRPSLNQKLDEKNLYKNKELSSFLGGGD